MLHLLTEIEKNGRIEWPRVYEAVDALRVPPQVTRLLKALEKVNSDLRAQRGEYLKLGLAWKKKCEESESHVRGLMTAHADELQNICGTLEAPQ